VPDNLPPGVSRQAGSVEEMKELFVGWDPMYGGSSARGNSLANRFFPSSLNKFLNNVTTGSIDKWKLMHRTLDDMENSGLRY
jgi:salicylate hydroxylase